MTDDELCGWLRSMLPASGFAPTENWAPWLGADRIEQLEREKAVVSDLWEQQKEIALDYLADCNKAADHIEAIILSNQELHSENERLRGALNDALSHCYNCSGDPHYIEEDEVTGDHLWTDCPICRSARTALGETK